MEVTLDKVKFFTDIELGISMNQFVLDEKYVSTIFVPVCTYNDDEAGNSNDEMVAVLEGVVYPWFGLSYRIDRIQFSMERRQRDMMDHSREAILHAQKIANLFVDEARLSKNSYFYVSNEVFAINKISENDEHQVEVPLILSNNQQTIRTEIYLF